uniref:Uncharacterized protein n=1 Tax=Candidatus Berkiella aquae TaxID=295108 RepID=A0A0Q9YLF4_9GAMM
MILPFIAAIALDVKFNDLERVWLQRNEILLTISSLARYPNELYPQQMICRVGAELPNNRNVYKIHEDCEVSEGNTPENSAAKGICLDLLLFSSFRSLSA